MKLDKGQIVRTLTKVAAPMMLRRIIRENVTGSSTKEVYEWLRDTKIWDSLSETNREYLVGYKPWDLTWLNLEWLVKAIGRYNKPVAYLVLTSPELQEKLESNISEVKEKLSA